MRPIAADSRSWRCVRDCVAVIGRGQCAGRRPGTRRTWRRWQQRARRSPRSASWRRSRSLTASPSWTRAVARRRCREAIGSDKPVLVNFIFTTCTTICPVMSAGMSQFLANLGAEQDRVRVVTISIDPETDTADVLRAYAARYHAPFQLAVPDRHAGGHRCGAASLRQLSRRQEQSRGRDVRPLGAPTRRGSRSTASRAPRRCCTRSWGTSVPRIVTEAQPMHVSAHPRGDRRRRASAALSPGAGDAGAGRVRPHAAGCNRSSGVR